MYGVVQTTATDVFEGGIFYIKIGAREIMLCSPPSSPSHLLVALLLNETLDLSFMQRNITEV